jgi:hypothetical protein
MAEIRTHPQRSGPYDQVPGGRTKVTTHREGSDDRAVAEHITQARGGIIGRDFRGCWQPSCGGECRCDLGVAAT